MNMRADLVFGSVAHVANRFQLCQLAAKATRKLHKPHTRLEDTMSDVLTRLHKPGGAVSVSSAILHTPVFPGVSHAPVIRSEPRATRFVNLAFVTMGQEALTSKRKGV